MFAAEHVSLSAVLQTLYSQDVDCKGESMIVDEANIIDGCSAIISLSLWLSSGMTEKVFSRIQSLEAGHQVPHPWRGKITLTVETQQSELLLFILSVFCKLLDDFQQPLFFFG